MILVNSIRKVDKTSMVIRMQIKHQEYKIKTILYLPRKVRDVLAEMAKKNGKEIDVEIIDRISRTLNEDLIQIRKESHNSSNKQGDIF